LSWGHIAELVAIDDPLERGFYEKQAILEKWSIRELRRQKKTSIFLRFASGKKKEEILQLAKQGAIIETPADLLRSPYVFAPLSSQRGRVAPRNRADVFRGGKAEGGKTPKSARKAPASRLTSLSFHLCKSV
jgi:hypothetical protein